MYHTIAALEATIAAQAVLIAAYGRSHLGILSGPAIRYELSQLTTPVDLLCFDWRKQNELNALLGWDAANIPLGRAARVDYSGVDRRAVSRGPDRRLTPRTIDLRGQIGGDEIAIAVDPGHGIGLLRRLLRELIIMNAELTPRQHAEISERTGGLISGFCVAAVLIENSTNALVDTMRAVDMTGTLKAGTITGVRATSGAKGTSLCHMLASRREVTS